MLNYAGEHLLGCYYCAGMGYQDYPSNTKPCPIEGHKKMADQNSQDVISLMESSKRPYSPEFGNCPYCLVAKKPVGINCKHWQGHGWKRDV